MANQEKFLNLLETLFAKFPELEPLIAWNQPMLTAHGTFIIGLSFATKHMSVAVHQPVFEASLPRLDETGSVTAKRFSAYLGAKISPSTCFST